MNNRSKISLLILLLVIGMAYLGYGQSANLEKLLSDPDKMYSKAFVYSGTVNPIRKWQIKKGFATKDDYALPKRVGLLTFVIEDRSNATTSTFGDYTLTSTRKATKDGVSIIATYVYDKVIGQMKQEFEAKGMSLLEVNEYLDTEEKQRLYANYELKALKGVKAFSGITGQGNSGPAIGYRVMSLPYFGSFPKAINARNDFFNQLDLDAILVVQIGMSIAGNYLEGVSSEILYRNPASGTKTIYSDYNEVVSVSHSIDKYSKKPIYGGIMMTEEVEYQNDKGKTKKRMEAVGLDPNLFKLIQSVVGANVSALEKYVTGT